MFSVIFRNFAKNTKPSPLLFVLILTILFTACGGGDSGPTGPDQSSGTIVVQNNSSFTIVEINISRCELDTWGANRVGSPMSPGSSRSFTLSPNCYDLRAIANTGDFVTFFDIFLEAGETETAVIFDQ